MLTIVFTLIVLSTKFINWRKGVTEKDGDYREGFLLGKKRLS